MRCTGYVSALPLAKGVSDLGPGGRFEWFSPTILRSILYRTVVDPESAFSVEHHIAIHPCYFNIDVPFQVFIWTMAASK